MKILIAGSHGMIGSAVTSHLIECGHDVVRLVRKAPGIGELYWDPEAGSIDTSGLEGFDAVIQLASMKWPMRWTRKSKEKLHANRIATYRLLAEALATCIRKPRVLVCASGIGVYPLLARIFLRRTRLRAPTSCPLSTGLEKQPRSQLRQQVSVSFICASLK